MMARLPLLERGRVQRFAILSSRISGAALRKAQGREQLPYDAAIWDEAKEFARQLRQADRYVREEEGISPPKASSIDALPTVFTALTDYWRGQEQPAAESPGGFLRMLESVFNEPEPDREVLATMASFFEFLASCFLKDLAAAALPSAPQRRKPDAGQ